MMDSCSSGLGRPARVLGGPALWAFFAACAWCLPTGARAEQPADGRPASSTALGQTAPGGRHVPLLLPRAAAPGTQAGDRALGHATKRRSALGPKTATEQAREAAFDSYYGLYVGGQKVGFMHATLVAEPKVVLAYALEATLMAMGKESQVTMQERRTFAPSNGLLTDVYFAQSSATGTVAVRGVRQGQQLAVEVSAGGAKQRHSVAVSETLADNLAAWRLARTRPGAAAAKVGDRAVAQHFDPVSQAVTEAQHAITKLEPCVLGGVPSTLVHVETAYPALSVQEAGVFDDHGQLLSTQIGGFFEARLEEQSVARRRDAPADLLLHAVVKVPRPLPGLAEANGLQVQLTGFAAEAPPSVWRQQVAQRGNDLTVNLRLEPAIPAALQLADLGAAGQSAGKRSTAKQRLAAGRMGQGGDPAAREVAEARLPSAFIQSDAAKIVQAATQAAQGKTAVAEVVPALVAGVRARLRSEYVPAFSNALEALESGRGDCTEHSVLFVAMARALGLPARVAVGMAYWPPGQGFGWHAWSEVWLGDRWLSVDPTWGQTVADVTHIKLAGGSPGEQLKVVMLLGRLGVADWRLQ